MSQFEHLTERVIALVEGEGRESSDLRELVRGDGPAAAFTAAAFYVEEYGLTVPSEILDEAKRVAEVVPIEEELEALSWHEAA